MNHVVIPLDESHGDALKRLAGTVADIIGVAAIERRPHPHVTMVAYVGLDATDARDAVTSVASSTSPFTVHAHGFGFFSGDHASELSLHLDVVRAGGLDRLHRRPCRALRRAGAEIAPWCEPDLWSPHLTLLDRELDAARLGTAAAWLARRHHPSWQIPVNRVTITGGWNECDRPVIEMQLGGDHASLAS